MVRMKELAAWYELCMVLYLRPSGLTKRYRLTLCLLRFNLNQLILMLPVRSQDFELILGRV